MSNNNHIDILEKGINLEKCLKCGCMRTTLEYLNVESNEDKIYEWTKKMQSIEYDCLGCKYCYPSEAFKISIAEEQKKSKLFE